MSRADGVLVVVLKAQPFRDIEAGVKLEEYRGFNWFAKICDPFPCEMWSETEMHRFYANRFHPYHTLRAFLGYAKDRPMIERPITHIDWGLPNPAWTYGIVSPGECFRIHLEPLKGQP
jgi:hypothetical protein